jgi:hypothetical protein
MNEVDKIVAAILAAAHTFKHPGAVNHIDFVHAYQSMLAELQKPDSAEIEAGTSPIDASEVRIKASELASRLEEVIRAPRPESAGNH